ncbi:MAG: hypothetical protein EOP49_51550 [Sphingobacteriales bacterium]|nr:MAG: hypothetical protein EOP49_51550 [Sphingobacteriales bacterium]
MKLYLAALILFMPLLVFFEAFEPAYELLINWYSQTTHVQEAFAPGFPQPSYATLIGWKLTAGFHAFPLFVGAFLKATLVSAVALLLLRLKPQMPFLLRLAWLIALILLLQYPAPFYHHFVEEYRFQLLLISAIVIFTPFLFIATLLLSKPKTKRLSA